MANILLETVVFRKGHKNSNGELAEWVIIQHDTGKLLSSHKSRSAAEKHLQQMEYYKHAKAESVTNYQKEFEVFVESVFETLGCPEASKPVLDGFQALINAQ